VAVRAVDKGYDVESTRQRLSLYNS
jgi:hypothetical protein